MKSSLKKLRFGLQKNDTKEKKPQQPKLDELVQATEDMQGMRSCYDGLLSAAAATANSAYEFSEAWQEMGACLLEKTSLNDDEESDRVLLMLGKVQFELQKLVDGYRTHVVQTITKPSESLLRELQTVEEMRRQCDDKRELYKFMLSAHIEKGTSKNSKHEAFSLKQLHAAQEDYEEEATLFIFRLKSLKQGQSRSLLTQASRHHAAQLNFFRKGLKFLEMVEPHVRDAAANQHIDYDFTGLEDNGTEDDNPDDSSFVVSEDGELSFDYGQSTHGPDVISTSRNSMELDQSDIPSAPSVHAEHGQDSSERNQADLLTKIKGAGSSSHSAPIYPDKKFDPSEKLRERVPSSTRKFHTYVLPTPFDVRAASAFSSSSGPIPAPQSVLSESSTPPPPSDDELPVPGTDPRNASATKKIKRNAHSGPLPSKAQSSKPKILVPDSRRSVDSSTMGPRAAMGPSPIHQPSTSSKAVSPSSSPPPALSPKISELHELPRPPVGFSRSTRPSSLVGHSAPLVSRSQENPASSRLPASVISSRTASPLPTPAMARSLSIPSSGGGGRTTAMASVRPGASGSSSTANELSSPPLTPISLSVDPPSVPTDPEAVSGPSKGEGMQ